MRISNRPVLTALVLALGAARSGFAQGTPVKVKEETAGLFKLAKITADAAQKTAQAQFPNGTIKSGELEKEKGKLIYTFDIQQPGVAGIEEVNVDAMTGAVVATEHENPAPPKSKAPKPPAKKPPAR